jgi:hypothetical protein
VLSASGWGSVSVASSASVSGELLLAMVTVMVLASTLVALGTVWGLVLAGQLA